MDPDGAWYGDRDVLVFSRWMSRHAPALLRSAREAGQVLVNDLDDYFWGLPPEHPALLATDPERNPDYNRENYLATFRESSLVTTSTPWLAERVREELAPEVPVRVVRNYVDLRAWEPRPPGRHVGWVGSTAGRAGDLEVLRSLSGTFARLDAALYHGGAIPGEPSFASLVGHQNVLVRGTQPPKTYPRLWDPMRIALIPLGPEPFSQAKSWCKALEACARGIPFVASTHPEYGELGAGRLASTTEEWEEHLEALTDPAVYAADAAANRQRAEGLSIAGHWEEWGSLLEEAAFSFGPVPGLAHVS